MDVSDPAAVAAMVAEAVAYLASDSAACVTGTVLRVDGGFTAHDPGYSFERA